MVRLCFFHEPAVLAGAGHGLLRALVDFPDDLGHRRDDQFYRNDLSSALARNGDQQYAAVPLQYADGVVDNCVRATGPDGKLRAPRARPAIWDPFLGRGVRRRSSALAAGILVLRPSLGLRHLLARDRNDLHDPSGPFPQACCRISTRRAGDRAHGCVRIRCLGALHVRGRNVIHGDELFQRGEHDDLALQRGTPPQGATGTSRTSRHGGLQACSDR
jgi:hypothetical protein